MNYGIYYAYWEKEWGGDFIPYIGRVKKLGGGLYSYWPVDYTLPFNKAEDMKRGITNIRQTGDLLGHLHLGEVNRRPPHGKGRIPQAEIGEALHDINYIGDVVMEPFVRMDGQIGKDIRIWYDLSNGCSDEELDKDAAKAVT